MADIYVAPPPLHKGWIFSDRVHLASWHGGIFLRLSDLYEVRGSMIPLKGRRKVWKSKGVSKGEFKNSGPSSLGVPGHTQILADQLTLFQQRGTDYAHLITTGTPRFSDLPTALHLDGFSK